MEKLFLHLRDYHKLSDEAEDALKSGFEQITLPKGELLLKEGQICRHLYFLERGAVRGFYTVDDKEITHWFGFEQDFVTSFHSFITHEPSVENIQLVEGSVLWRIPKEKLTALFNSFHDIERVVRIAYEKYYIRLEERYVNSQFRSAAERYEKLLGESPHIISRVPLGQVASFLGITQETLSRIRNKGVI